MYDVDIHLVHEYAYICTNGLCVCPEKPTALLREVGAATQFTEEAHILSESHAIHFAPAANFGYAAVASVAAVALAREVPKEARRSMLHQVSRTKLSYSYTRYPAAAASAREVVQFTAVRPHPATKIYSS